MRIEILFWAFVAHVIGFWCKSDQAFIIDVYTKGIHASNKNIYAQIELVIINQQGVADVLANYGFLVGATVSGSRLNLIQVFNDINTFSLRALGRFYDPNIIMSLIFDWFVFSTILPILFVLDIELDLVETVKECLVILR